MSAPPYMPLYVADYLADTTHLSTLEHGAYVLLLMSMWRSGGTLPDDDAKLAKFARMTPAQWARVRHTVMQFFDVSDGVVTQRRLAVEIEKHANVVRQRRESGSRGGKAKALKDKKPNVASASGLPWQPEPELELKVREEESLSPRAKDFETFWAAYPKKVGKPAALKAFPAAVKKTSVAAMVVALGSQRQSRKWREGFIPDPVKWLKNDGWDDQLDGAPPSPDDPLPPGAARSPSGTIYYPNAAW